MKRLNALILLLLIATSSAFAGDLVSVRVVDKAKYKNNSLVDKIQDFVIDSRTGSPAVIVKFCPTRWRGDDTVEMFMSNEDVSQRTLDTLKSGSQSERVKLAKRLFTFRTQSVRGGDAIFMSER